jgi:DNA-binding GntR family transcriptional regulator
MRQLGSHASSQALHAAITSASEQVACALSVLPGTEVVRRVRVRKVDVLPIALERSHALNTLCQDCILDLLSEQRVKILEREKLS